MCCSWFLLSLAHESFPRLCIFVLRVLDLCAGAEATIFSHRRCFLALVSPPVSSVASKLFLVLLSVRQTTSGSSSSWPRHRSAASFFCQAPPGLAAEPAIGFGLCAQKLISSELFTERLFCQCASQILPPAWSEMKISPPIALVLVSTLGLVSSSSDARPHA
jgi:hypothetical protein